ncbi:MAG: hypothetical protein R3297_04850 [Desulfobulbales bacterium]|nr:hypothetical protein [Desulfobulbales bacterium]
MSNQFLLKTLDACEYPAEFLVARLLGKRGSLFRNWEFLLSSSDAVQSLQDSPFYPYLRRYAAAGVWHFLRDEHLWIYRKMNPSLRKSFTPYFIFHEIKILLVCLRLLHAGSEREPVLQELHNSLLHGAIEDILTSADDFVTMLHGLETYLSRHSDIFQGFCARYEKEGLAALEIFIRNSFFTYIFSLKQPVQLLVFMQDMVDFHNCLALAKAIRWHSEPEPDFIPGGKTALDIFRKAYFSKEMTPLLRVVGLQDYPEADSTPQELETTVLTLITLKLKRKSYQRTVTGDILFYLWLQYCYTRNISMILHTIQVDDELVRKSMVA